MDKNEKDKKEIIEMEELLKQEAESLAEEFIRNNEFAENNLVVIQKTDHTIESIEDQKQKLSLQALYKGNKYKLDYAISTMVKGILKQNRLFFSISKDSLVKAIGIDPDNHNKAASIDMKPFQARLAKHGICQLWDSIQSSRKEDRRVAGFVVVNPKLLALLKIDKEIAKKQFEELKELSENDWVTEDMVFDSCGELRIKIEEQRDLIVERRLKKSEPTGKNKDCITNSISEVEILELNAFLNKLIKAWENGLIDKDGIPRVSSFAEKSYRDLHNQLKKKIDFGSVEVIDYIRNFFNLNVKKESLHQYLYTALNELSK